METLEKNRVFDRAAMEELLEIGKDVMQTAISVTVTLRDTLSQLEGISESIPSEAKEAGFSSTIRSVKNAMETEVYEQFQRELIQVLTKVLEEIPMYDKQMAHEVDELSASVEGVRGMVSELKGFLKEDALFLSLEEFERKLSLCQEEWESETIKLSDRLEIASKKLLGLQEYACLYSTDPVNLVSGNLYMEKELLCSMEDSFFSFGILYNAMSKERGCLSRGFRHTYSGELVFLEEDRLLVRFADASVSYYEKEANGRYRCSETPLVRMEESKEGYEVEKAGEKYRFEKTGELVERVFKNGEEVRYVRDEGGSLLQVRHSSGKYLTFLYGERGLLEEVRDNVGRAVTFYYENKHLTQVETSYGQKTEYGYDETGRLCRVCNEKQEVLAQHYYDAHKRVVKQVYADGGVQEYRYGKDGRIVEMTERDGSILLFEKDGKERLKKVTGERGSVRYNYNQKGQLLCQRKEDGTERSYEYDEQDRVVSKKDELGRVFEYGYEKDGRLGVVEAGGVSVLVY